MRLFLSITDQLAKVHFTAEIVGWDDKRLINKERREAIERVLNALQPGEGGLYNLSNAADGVSVNLIQIRRLRRVDKPFSVERLLKVYGRITSAAPNSARRVGVCLE